MSVRLNHTIVWCRDPERSARFLTEILGLPTPSRSGHFVVVEADNEVSLDFGRTDRAVAPQHYAFLIGEADFDEVLGRIRERRLTYWADPARTQPGAINRHGGGRGAYFEDPDGHILEVLTRPCAG